MHIYVNTEISKIGIGSHSYTGLEVPQVPAASWGSRKAGSSITEYTSDGPTVRSFNVPGQDKWTLSSRRENSPFLCPFLSLAD